MNHITQDASFTFNTADSFEVRLVANNDDPDCRQVMILTIEPARLGTRSDGVACPVVADFYCQYQPHCSWREFFRYEYLPECHHLRVVRE